MNKYMKSMRGITVLGMLITVVLLVFVVVLGINLAPPYIHHFAVQDAMESLAKDPELKSMSKAKLRDMFLRKLQVNYITNIPADKLEVTKKDGKTALTLNYEVRVHLVANIDAVIKFNEEALVE
ncbi:MAG: hypothetical protein BGO43_11980 [Gammaproteobacteria bacterium 39-13]|nr:DUF4845 domain-containing protein [Gammaproteobacteria bacterium]OJV85337.1 MAG: hypothetical protein BGO43_11980 [Gammaproteobacteria bacterium 39-13]